MKIIKSINEMNQLTQSWREENLSVGLVPTMGYLHDGHMSLVKASVEDNRKTVVSIFVNPIQFGKGEDLESYPRNEKQDIAVCESGKVDAVFIPSVEEMYPKGFNTFVDSTEIGGGITGEARPGHFKGVCTVVNKLFNIVCPCKAYFGQKDAQQLAVIKSMVTDLNINVEIIGCPTVREHDGLAMSSRNSYLNKNERDKSIAIYKVLNAGRKVYEDGGNSQSVRNEAVRVLEEEHDLQTDYIHVVDPVSMKPRDDKFVPLSGDMLLISVTIGKTTLIDNIIL